MKNNKEESKKEFLFGKKNYKFLFIGLGCMALGFILMSGGYSEDPEVFNQDIYNFRRIRLAPTLVLVGLGIQIYAILTSSKK
jgi:hypothetical protein